MKYTRILEKDVVRIKKGLPGKTGVVLRVDGESACVVVTQGNPSGIGVWFSVRELKRIGRVSK